MPAFLVRSSRLALPPFEGMALSGLKFFIEQSDVTMG